MNAATVNILVQTFAVNAEIESMKVANIERQSKGLSLAYGEEAFNRAATELRDLSNELTNKIQNGYAE